MLVHFEYSLRTSPFTITTSWRGKKLARTVANLDTGRLISGGLEEERLTIPLTEMLAKARAKTQQKGKGKHVDVVETEQPQPSEAASTVSYPSQDPSLIEEFSCISNVDPWIMGVTINSVSSTRRQAGAEYLLLDSGAQLHACPITYPGKKIPLSDPGIHTASGTRLQQDGGRLVTYRVFRLSRTLPKE